MFDWFKDGKSELGLVLGVIGILMLLFTPVPATVLDFLLLTNFSLGMVILLLTFYTDKPLSFSTFPSLLLIATLFRLGLNVSSTRLILNDADAGKVIEAVGSHVVGGNYVIGLVVFLILIVVQYVVVTNGAQRVAEVAARFTLDSMPGKQMSIDADLNMGIVDENEAKRRRLDIEKEANFYGAMDGATKFVKGDAIAGIIIIIINIIGGLSIGVAHHNMPWGEALRTFTLLTVGDGIVTQIPSLVIATATGIIITRAASDAQLGTELAKQFSSQPRVLAIIAITLILMMFMPGLPVMPILVLAALFIAGVFLTRGGNKSSADTESSDKEPALISPAGEGTGEDDLYLLTQVSPFELRLGNELIQYLDQDGNTLTDRLHNFRKQFALDFGVVLPTESPKADTSLAENEYRICLQGANVAKGEVYPECYLAIDPSGQKKGLAGKETREPTYGLPALWVDNKNQDLARSAGFTVVDPETTFLTHITETLKRFSSELLTRHETEKLVQRVAETQPGLVDELIPTIMSYSDIQRVLQFLLQEKVSVRNLPMILEVLVEFVSTCKQSEQLADKVRSKLKNQICQTLADDQGMLQILTLESRLEQKLVAGINQSEEHTSLMLDPALTEYLLKSLTSQVEQMMSKRLPPVLLCAPVLRRQLYLFCERAIPQLHVLSLNEMSTNIHVKAFAMVSDMGGQAVA